MNIIGISALYHDAACCLLKDGKLIAAVQEERFTRKKSDASIPVQAFRYCLEEGKIAIGDIDAIAYYEDPVKKLARQLWSGHDYTEKRLQEKLDPRRPQKEIKELLGFDAEVRMYDHHLSHAASSYYFSGFEQAAILTVDGVGEWASTTYGLANQHKLELLEQVDFPHSLGLLYATITSFLGFKVNDGEYKVMGLAPYGEPVYADKIRRLLNIRERGQYELDMQYFRFINGNRMYSEELSGLLGLKPRKPESALLRCHLDMAKSLQVVLEDVLIEKVTYLFSETGAANLCMAGGVALNCVANGRIIAETPFAKLYVQPAANDAGCALGAAALAHIELGGKREDISKMEHAYLGPSYSNAQVRDLLEQTSLIYTAYEGDSDAMLQEVAGKIDAGEVVGWFQGRMEFGPRSLGARSILADPRGEEMRDKINLMVKQRESFRPFAPAVLENLAAEHFDIDHSSPFMLETCQVKSPLNLPAITHVDNSARVQTVNADTSPLFAALIEAFNDLSGCPILLNTSFNVRGEPIVNTPADALICFLRSGIDSLVIADFIIDKKNNSTEMLEYALANYKDFRQSDIAHEVYTFL